MNNKYGVYFLEFADSVEVYAGEGVSAEYIEQIEKSLTDKGYEPVDGKSGAKFIGMKSVDLQPLEKSSNLADQVIEKLSKRASESVVKEDELPYWHPKAQMANARRVREMERQQRFKNPTKPATTPAPTQPNNPAPVPGVPPVLAGGTGKKYIDIADKKECSGKEDCGCESCSVEKSGYGPKGGSQYNAADNARRKATRTGAEVEGVGQNKAVRQYTSAKMGTAKQQAASEAKLARKLSGPIKTYTPEEIETYKKRMNKSLEWTERELANKIAKLPMFNNAPPRQPTNEELFTGMTVSEEQAQVAQQSFDNKFTNFFQEVQKPIGDLKKFANEEEEIAYWRSISVRPPSGGEGQN